MVPWRQVVEQAVSEQVLSSAQAPGTVRALEAASDPRRALEGLGFPAPVVGWFLARAQFTDPTRETQALRMALHRGYRLSGYEVQGELGRGAMGAVLAARRLADGADVAVKVLLGPGLRDPRARERFFREAKAASGLQHPGLVRVLDTGEERGLPYLVMERIEGGATLADTLSDLGQPALLKVLAAIADALDYAHAQGIVHRDLKPGNVLLRGDGSPVVTDFGLALDLASGSSLTQSGTLLGTPLYMSPEQCRGQRPGPSGDVYSLGVIAYEGLCGEPPFVANSLVEQLARILHEAPRSLRRRRPDVPRWLGELVLRCLDKKSASRPSMTEFSEGLAARGQGVSGGRSGGRRAALAVVLTGSLLAGLLVAAGAGPGQVADPTTAPEVVVPPSNQHVLTLQPGPLQGHDTTVNEQGLYGNDNQGVDALLQVGEREDMPGSTRAFLRFDLASLPAGAVVERATLALFHHGASYHDSQLDLLAHAVASCPPRTPWKEGTGLSDDYLEGMAWEGDSQMAPRGFEASTMQSGRPDLTQPDVDLVRDFGLGANGLVAQARVEAGTAPSWVEWDVTALVRAWADGELENHGLRLSHAQAGPPWSDGQRMFASSDFPKAERRPKLTIAYRGDPPLPVPSQEEERAAGLAEAARLLDQLDRAELGWGDEAWAAARRAVEVAPELGRAFHWRGRLMLSRGYWSGGVTEMRRAAGALLPYQTAAHYGLWVRGLLRIQEPGFSLRVLKTGRELFPGDPWLASLQAEALSTSGDLPAAAAALEPFLRDVSIHWSILSAQAMLDATRGRREEAVRRLERACELLRVGSDPMPSVRPFAFLARLYEAQGRDDEVARILGFLQRRGWTDPEALWATVSTLRALGDPGGARDLLDRAEARWPGHPMVDKLR